jgi:hypothetical protein
MDYGYCHVTEWDYTEFGLLIGFIELLNTNAYDSLTELRTPNITISTAHIKSS